MTAAEPVPDNKEDEECQKKTDNLAEGFWYARPLFILYDMGTEIKANRGRKIETM